MAHEYCECNSGISGFSCSCAGVTYYCQCNSYGGGEVANISFDNHTSSGCPSNIYTPLNTYSSTDIDTLYNLLNTEIKSGEKIYASSLSSLWNIFINMINYKKDKNNADYKINYNYNKPIDLSNGNIIKSDHFENLKSNIQTVHTGSYALVDGGGTGFTAPDGTTTRSISDSYVTEYDPGSVIFANEVGKLAKWIGASYYHCVCNSNTNVKCCSCNIVCDCNY